MPVPVDLPFRPRPGPRPPRPQCRPRPDLPPRFERSPRSPVLKKLRIDPGFGFGDYGCRRLRDQVKRWSPGIRCFRLGKVVLGQVFRQVGSTCGSNSLPPQSYRRRKGQSHKPKARPGNRRGFWFWHDWRKGLACFHLAWAF